MGKLCETQNAASINKVLLELIEKKEEEKNTEEYINVDRLSD